MAHLHTHYDNLKVARNAPPEVIRAAYKTLSQKYHPDRNPHRTDAIRIIQIINAAYDILSDPVKRQEHDDWIARMESGEQAETATPSRPAETAQRRTTKPSRATPFSVHRFRHKTASGTARLLHKARSLINRFSRRILSRG